MKTCSRCKESKSTDQFRNNSANPDSLARYCKGCHRKIDEKHRRSRSQRSDSEILEVILTKYPELVKRCSMCKLELSIDSFASDRTIFDGLSPRCRSCSSLKGATVRAARARKHTLGRSKMESKKCPKCGTVSDNFGHDSTTVDGFRTYCRSCTKDFSAEIRLRLLSRTSDEMESDQNRLRPDGKKACFSCKAVKPLGRFYKHSSQADGLSAMCKDCHNERKVDRRLETVSALKEKYGNRCLYPGCEETENLQIDHVVPRSRGGVDDFSNYQLLCREHNMKKFVHDTDYRPAIESVLDPDG